MPKWRLSKRFRGQIDASSKPMVKKDWFGLGEPVEYEKWKGSSGRRTAYRAMAMDVDTGRVVRALYDKNGKRIKY